MKNIVFATLLGFGLISFTACTEETKTKQAPKTEKATQKCEAGKCGEGKCGSN